MSTVVTERDGHVLLARLNRPDVLNAFDPEMTDRLARVVDEAESDPGVHVLTITGTGRAFSAGHDLSAPPDPGREFGTAAMFKKLTLFPKPLVLAINGLAVGLGVTLTSFADVAVIADDARLRCPFVGMGLTAEAGSTYQLTRLLGPQRAAWFLMSGAWLSARESVEAGLAMECVPDGRVLDRAREMAGVLAAQPLDSLMETKRLLNAPHREALIANIRAENEAVMRLREAPAHREAVNAFRARRAPDFSEANLARYSTEAEDR
ncbi:enoyl-CoA hydratase/isomerase family protein [Actinomadura sp. 7K534]|uniref:enoyl-CoA hydratase/isomerase family protein n=1 Tax=Actinomadura sp. 7K534 TaxID=2530366 RepID=UPI001052520B|nr:enoyl-CoA hydratase/isomerase family protein [Actinomadura sp. 7K534]TDB95179.1 enoyl-CoA hydratase/isomerase family protein [Actinomadura sp. 7K534]